MPDENITPGAAGQGETTEAPNSGQGFDYERGYNELRPEFTRTTQRLSEYEGLFAALHDPDPAVQAEAAQLLGLEFAEDTGAPSGQPADDDEWSDPLEAEVKELRDLVAELRDRSELEATARQEQETIDMRDEYIGEAISFIEQQAQTTFSESEEEVLGNLAIAMADQDDVPDVQGAYERLYGDNGVIESRFQQRIESKKQAAQAPGLSTVPAEKRPKNASERIAFIDQRVQALADQQ